MAAAAMAELRARAVAHLKAGEYEACLALLQEARRSNPYNLELLRSVRVLEYYLRPQKRAG
ncbi:MAG: hypothetical protein AAGF12_43555 [Myxococcota bacterium]